MTEKITGIIAEFNPFHNGHKYLLDNAEGLKLVVMSGNWMQRGEPAVVDKWLRAEMALKNGADLVVELPFLAAVNGADHFAQAAVDILHKLGVDEIFFGSESDSDDYQKIADIYEEKADEMSAYIETLPELMSFPLKQEKAWQKFAGVKFDGHTPNHILGLAYAKAVKGKGIKMRTIKRESSYNSTEIKGNMASAKAIREAKDESQIADLMPENAWSLYQKAPKARAEDYWQMLRYRINQAKVTGDLQEIFQVNEEMANRILANYQKSSSWEDLVTRVYTKRYTKGHIRRLLTYILMDARDQALPEAVHVLGFSANGRQILARAKSELETANVTRIGKEPWDKLSQYADSIYELGNQKIPEQNFGRKPIMK